MSGVQRRSSLAQAEVEGDRDLDPGSEIAVPQVMSMCLFCDAENGGRNAQANDS